MCFLEGAAQHRSFNKDPRNCKDGLESASLSFSDSKVVSEVAIRIDSDCVHMQVRCSGPSCSWWQRKIAAPCCSFYKHLNISKRHSILEEVCAEDRMGQNVDDVDKNNRLDLCNCIEV